MADHDGVEPVITMAWRAHVTPHPTTRVERRNTRLGFELA